MATTSAEQRRDSSQRDEGSWVCIPEEKWGILKESPELIQCWQGSSNPHKPWTTFSHGNHPCFPWTKCFPPHVSVLTYPLMPFTMNGHLPWKLTWHTICNHTYMESLSSVMRLSPRLCCECLKIETDVCLSVLHPYSLASCKDTCSVEIWRDLIDSRTTVRSQSASLQPPALPFTVV